MRYIDSDGEGGAPRIVWSASDLKSAAECEFAWLRAIDAKLGRVAAVVEPDDATLARAGRLGTLHELRQLDAYRTAFPGRVVELPETRSSDAEGIASAVAGTNAALADPAVAVVYQAVFATDEFVGFADFLVRDPSTGSGTEGRWVVQDTKLARHARVTALMQLAAYVDQLDRLGVPRSDRVELLLGDGTTSEHAVRDLMPVFRLRRERLRALIADRDLGAGAAGEAIAWGDERGALRIVACGRCATCDAEVIAHRDLLLVAGMRPVQRTRLREAGIRTIDDLAAAREAPERMSWDTFAGLRTQARLQLESPAGGVVPLAGHALPGAAENRADDGGDSPDVREAAPPAIPTYRVVFPKAIGALPRPDRGDLFFDFEGDPLFTETPPSGATPQWGIDYLFGWVDDDEQYSALWAHTFADEKRALEDFLDFVSLRRRAHPGMHIYHYAPYEPTHLLAMSARYGVREAEVDTLLREGVFVDLYPIVRRALRVGSRSYSIKKLEPLYMGDEVRTSEVQKGDDSIVRYVEARALADAGDGAGGERILADLADYNRYDCVSTRRLRDWLVERAREAGLVPSADVDAAERPYEPSPRAEALTRLACAAADLDAPDAAAVAALKLGAAAIDYYPRESKTFWATHFLRLREPVSIWEDTRDVVVFDHDRCRVLTDWHIPEGARVQRRVLELRGDLAPGTKLTAGASVFLVYELPAPFPLEASPRWIHAPRSVRVVDVLDDGVVVEENSLGGFTWQELPLALTPPAPPLAGSQQAAIDRWADRVIEAGPAASADFPHDAATDLLLRRAPRTGRGALARGGVDDVADIIATVYDLDRSYLAVQGPPGTGKTYVGSHVIARLVAEKGYRVGVVAQSHAVVENMLARIVEAGLPGAQVGKATKAAASGDEAFTAIAKDGYAAFADAHPEGFVIGGTAWDLSHAGRVPRDSLDLLVIDEAGQFSLASTIAVSVAARRLLLLGDPQQLPQVSQGTHPEPVDTSALGWVMDGAAVIPGDRGYFLAQTRRMRPEVAEPVSQLSYDGRLAAHASTSARHLDGIAPGVIPVPLGHTGNATASPEEAEAVVEIVRGLVGRSWTSSDDAEPRPLEPSDLIVVTPYNAQQVTVERALADAGFDAVPVGTVDKFQGQEAAVAIVSLAASSGRDAPRGLEFLLLQNRLNVAVSRAEHTAYVVYGTGLLDDLPRTPDGVTRLSAFARLVGADADRRAGTGAAPPTAP